MFVFSLLLRHYDCTDAVALLTHILDNDNIYINNDGNDDI